MFERYLPSNSFTVFDISEHDSAGQCIEEHQQEHAEYDEEALADADADGQHQHLECGVFARYRKEPEYHYHEPDEI